MQIEFTKNNKVFKNKIFADPWFDSDKIEFNDINIDDVLDINIINFHQEWKEGRMKNQVGPINSTIQHKLVI